MQRFRGGLVFKDLRLLYHYTLSLRVVKKKEKKKMDAWENPGEPAHLPQKALRGLSQGSLLEIGVRSWSQFVGIYRQRLTFCGHLSSKVDILCASIAKG